MKRHKFDALSFGFGLIFILIALTFLIPTTAFDLGPTLAASLKWVWPAVILTIGAAIVVPLAMPRKDPVDPEEPTAIDDTIEI